MNLDRSSANIKDLLAEVEDGTYFSFTSGKLESPPAKMLGEDTLLIFV